MEENVDWKDWKNMEENLDWKYWKNNGRKLR